MGIRKRSFIFFMLYTQPMSIRPSVFDTDLSKMPTTFLELKRLHDSCEGIRGVNHRAQIHCVQGSDHFNLMTYATYSYSVQCLLSPHQEL
jgi:hypothetical protein